ncbi:DUF6707 family protein [Pseudomonas sp. DTU_2021_1001937_2_SI_NGA_ILE_001]|uniref:DUF6707 family protein n=1 Tax=Pseudomonas sp. DTU_2021_1001937_2_SI_NGA_ILE_001 TaxID=3077589 RepID=UPI0028FC29E9|nr:DUF6707 family protein [Pseudomonas sp. DTU_2021_1001937_2_SI_NGA_ILE_001]WNW12480.1 DUF6707 family protein [Pseudomonas sp. DTU_2021_1001937_2_SI_NGA_ILE_001]
MNTDDIKNSLISANSDFQKHIEKLPKRSQKTAKSLLEAVVRLAYVLYSSGETEQAEQLVGPLSEIPFSNSYDYWTWIEAALVLKGTLAKAAGDKIAFTEALQTAQLALETGTELQVSVKAAVHQRFLNGQMLDDSFDQEDDERDAFEMRINYLMTLCKIRFFGGSETWPDVRTESAIAEVVGKINASVQAYGIHQLPPFK